MAEAHQGAIERGEGNPGVADAVEQISLRPLLIMFVEPVFLGNLYASFVLVLCLSPTLSMAVFYDL